MEISEEAQEIKCVVVGDAGVGKSSLIKSYNTPDFISLGEYSTTMIDDYYEKEVKVNGVTVRLGIWDTAGNEEYIYDKQRRLLYQTTDVFVICFSLVKRSSFASARATWYPQVRFYGRDAPVLLVGTKLDLREYQERGLVESEDRVAIVTKDDGEKMMKDMYAVTYVECSAVTTCEIKRVFDEAAKAAFKPRQKEEKRHSRCDCC